MFQARYQKYTLHFKRPGGTSRGVLTEKESWFLFIGNGYATGIGECSIIKGLSIDPTEDYEKTLQEVCEKIKQAKKEEGIAALVGQLTAYPSIQFGVEMALKDLQNGGKRLLFDSDFTASVASIPINGLVWMDRYEFMEQQVKEKIDAGFDCIKLKIGALNFEQELALIRKIRALHSPAELMIRVDANGAFSREDCARKLAQLAELHIHSIEQPIPPGNPAGMAALCASSPLPIALDEELIGIVGYEQKKQLLEIIRPQFIILKPSLIGGFRSSAEWIQLAEANNAGWWVTSALESNIGLNAIAQWTYALRNPLHQGLGTGQLYKNNIPSPLSIESGVLKHGATGWDLSILKM